MLLVEGFKVVVVVSIEISLENETILVESVEIDNVESSFGRFLGISSNLERGAEKLTEYLKSSKAIS